MFLRGYGFDANGNRTTSTSVTGTACTSTGAATAQLQLAGPRGDINATVTLDPGQQGAGIDSWTPFTEYGAPETPAAQGSTTGLADSGYGWLGTQQRASLEALGITLMGARLYKSDQRTVHQH